MMPIHQEFREEIQQPFGQKRATLMYHGSCDNITGMQEGFSHLRSGKNRSLRE